jgi:hypothetical protein
MSSTSAVNSPRVMPATSFGTAVVIALIEEPEGPKLMVDPIPNKWMLRIHGVRGAVYHAVAQSGTACA